jgi:hypothetical protein
MMPLELKRFYDSLPSSLENNSREIVRRDWERMKNKHPMVVENYFNSKYGLGMDLDTYEPDWYNTNRK